MAVSYDFSGQTAIVTGGAKGIGRAIAERLKQSGADVWVWDVVPLDLKGIRSLQVDVTNPVQIAAAVKQVAKETELVEILVSNAGRLGEVQPFELHTRENWRQIIESNLLGTFEVCHQVLPLMRRDGSGRIVTLGSMAGKEGARNMPVYSAASAGIIAFTKALGRELAHVGIRVNCVTPGPIETDLITSLGNSVVSGMIASSPMLRLGHVDEVAALILWLCSEDCTFSTGAVFDVSGGRGTY